MPKDFYSISDFYRTLQDPRLVPTAHRHFQVYLYPIYYYDKQVVTIRDNDFYNSGRYSSNGMNKIMNMRRLSNPGNGFFNEWFTEDTIEQFSLAIQQITIPRSFGTPTTKFNSPFGDYFGVDNNRFYGTSINGNEVSFQLIDQMEPFFEKKINDWIFAVNRCTVPNQKGTLFPKVNMAIKYFKQTEVAPGNTPHPNFIYYFKEAFPVKFDTCSIDHNGNDSQNDLRRTLVFNFNTMYVLHNKKMAERYRLGYLFDQVTVS